MTHTKPEPGTSTYHWTQMGFKPGLIHWTQLGALHTEHIPGLSRYNTTAKLLHFMEALDGEVILPANELAVVPEAQVSIGLRIEQMWIVEHGPEDDTYTEPQLITRGKRVVLRTQPAGVRFNAQLIAAERGSTTAPGAITPIEVQGFAEVGSDSVINYLWLQPVNDIRPAPDDPSEEIIFSTLVTLL